MGVWKIDLLSGLERPQLPSPPDGGEIWPGITVSCGECICC